MVSIKFIAIFAVLSFGVASAQSGCECKYKNELWGDVNPNLYYFCNPSTNKSVQMQCQAGYGFMKTAAASGCVPWSQWPSNCVKLGSSVPTCTSSNLNQPIATLNPNQYYLCLGVGQDPSLMSCISGRGFVSTAGGYLGCAEWSQWRSINSCNND